MDDLRHKLDKLMSDAAECEQIASAAAEHDKREAFIALAVQYRKMADAIRQVIAERANVPWLDAEAPQRPQDEHPPVAPSSL